MPLCIMCLLHNMRQLVRKQAQGRRVTLGGDRRGREPRTCFCRRAVLSVLSAFAPAGLAGMNVPGYRPPRMGGADGNAVYRVQLGGGSPRGRSRAEPTVVVVQRRSEDVS